MPRTAMKPKPGKPGKPPKPHAGPAVRKIIVDEVKKKIAAEGLNLLHASRAIGLSPATVAKALTTANFNSKTQAKLEAYFNGAIAAKATEPEELNGDNVKSLGEQLDEVHQRGPDGSEWNSRGVCINAKRHELKLAGVPKFTMGIETGQTLAATWRVGTDFKVHGERAAGHIDPCALDGKKFEHPWQAIAAGVKAGEEFLRKHKATKKQFEAWAAFGKKYGVVQLEEKPKKKLTKLDEALQRAETAERALKAYKARDRHEKLLASNVKECETEVEAAQAELKERKKELEDANMQLATFVRAPVAGDVETGRQETLIPKAETPKGKVEPLVMPERDGEEAYKLGKPHEANPYQPEQPEHALWTAGYMGARWTGAEYRKASNYGINWSTLIGALLEPAGLPPGEAAPKVKAISAVGYHWLVVDGWRRSEKDEARFALVQLVKKDDWRDLWQSKYGPPCAGVDASDEAKAARLVGGPACGRVVHVDGVPGDFVVAPREAFMVLTVPPVMAAAAAASSTAVDGKARAANDAGGDE